ncbi:LysE/ArgO family amino acid transporter [Nioella nitratireducens]|uniref:LysE/ArgO family amino acid transporter n=1 Tax=Nioella nitratireducens TaxID=1287720 RepID=UPI0008FD587E|nr:LysE/ArgO family amino acid transporter [Nioella nitratireducens]
MFHAVYAGFSLGLSLILAIGAQNAFVLRQGLRRVHVLPVVLVCAVSDAVLVTVGVSSFSIIAGLLPWIAPALRYGGAAFLIWYGARSVLSAWRGGDVLRAADTGEGSLRAAVLTCLALTWLNPHVYLDTVMLIGTVSTQYGAGAVWFGAGAVAASFVFFFALGYGARLLAPVFARPRAWQVLDVVIAGVMWAIAAKLIVMG